MIIGTPFGVDSVCSCTPTPFPNSPHPPPPSIFPLDNFLAPFLRTKHPKILLHNAAMQRSLEIYVPLQFSLVPPRTGQVMPAAYSFSLEQFMKALLRGTLAEIRDCFPALSRPHTDTRVFFVQGVAGAGKSLFCWRTMQFWDEEFVISPSPGTGRLPVVITLPHVKSRVLDAPADFLVQGIIDAYPTLAACFEHLDWSSRQELFLGLPFLFFLDSVDELSDAPAIANVNRLYNPGQWRESVFVITCRSDVLDGAVVNSALAPRQFLPDGPVQPALITSLYLLPFSAPQRDVYVTVFARNYADLHQGWTAEQYTRAIRQFSELDSLLQEPLQLFLVLSVLPILVAGKEDTTPTDFCVKHQGVGHAVHLLYQDKDLALALKLAVDIEEHPEAKRKGVTVFLKTHCGCGADRALTAMCRRHLELSDVIIPLMSASVDSTTAGFLGDLVLAMTLQAAGKVKVAPLYLATPSELATKLLQTGDISSAVEPSLKALGQLQGFILKQDRQDWKPFVDIIVKHFETRKLLLCVCARVRMYIYMLL